MVKAAQLTVADDIDCLVVFSDLHAHAVVLPALTAAFEAVGGRQQRVFNGDLFHGGPEPAATAAWVQEQVGAYATLGNHDENMLRRRDEPPRPPFDEAGAYQRLSPAQRAYFAALPHRLELAWGGRSIALMHGHLTPQGGAGSWRATPAEQTALFAQPAFDLCICGHTHYAYLAEADGTLMANTGSVSLPIVGIQLPGETAVSSQGGNAPVSPEAIRSSFLVVRRADGRLTVEIVRFDYDREAGLRALAAAGEPRMSLYEAWLGTGILRF